MNPPAPATRAHRVVDAVVFSSAWLASAAGVLVGAASHAMGIPIRPEAVGLAVCGTLVVYNVDRLRDLERDRRTSPDRSAFISDHKSALVAVVAAAAVAAVAFAASTGPRALWVLLPVLCAGLLHRRLKRFDAAKAVYITVAWLAVVVGLPRLLDPNASGLATVSAIFGATIGANAIASNIRDSEAIAGRFGQREALWVARAVAGVGIAIASFSAPQLRPLAALPVSTLAALVAFRPTERFGLLAVDGALLIGGALAIAFRSSAV